MLDIWKINEISNESYSYLREKCFEYNWDLRQKYFNVDTDAIIIYKYIDKEQQQCQRFSWSKDDIEHCFNMPLADFRQKYPQILFYEYNYNEYILIAPVNSIQKLLEYGNSIISLKELADSSMHISDRTPRLVPD